MRCIMMTPGSSHPAMLALLLCAVAAPAVADTAPQAAIVPRPQSVEFGGDSLGLAAEFKFVAALLGKRSSTLTAALTRFGALLSPGGGAAPAAADATASGAAPAPALASCSVHVAGSSLALDLSTDESYTLTISAAGACGISAPTIYGAMHGMESFVQLADRATCTVPTVAIADRPRFPFRGAMIDTARHWYPLPVILQHLDAMSATKMNALHWHLVDSQSFPYVSKAFPQLSEHGAYHPTEVYSQEDIMRVVHYAKERGIRVIPEIDTPGHVWAGFAAMEPAVLTTCYEKDGTVAGTGPMDPSKESTFTFLQTLLKEIMPLFESETFMVGGEFHAPTHILHTSLLQLTESQGLKPEAVLGDEVPHDCWASNPGVRKFAKAKGFGSDLGKLESYYGQRLLAILAAQNTSAMCWEEVFQAAQSSGVALAKDSLVNVWRGGWEWCTKPTSGGQVVRTNVTCSPEYGTSGPWFGKMHVRDNSWTTTMATAAAAGYQTVLSSPFYLNAENSGSNFDEVWPWYYSIEPTAFDIHTELSAQQREASVAGVEACMWSEWVDRSNFMPRFWPSAAAVAERGWSAKNVTDIDDFRRRIHAITCELQARGLPASPAIFGGGFFFENGTVCGPGASSGPGARHGVGVLGPQAQPGCLPRFSSCKLDDEEITTITVGPTTLSENAPFGGIGGASGGGGGTRLLVDYPEQQRSDILDMLFKPLHGASLQHCKVEVGCDGDTTQGSEPTHARSATDIDFDRGYEVWFMEEAVKRRAEMQLSGLEWGIPGWVAEDGMWSKTNVDYLTGWASGLRDKKGLNITALAVAWNERTYDTTFIKEMRKALDAAGLAHVKTIAPDGYGHMWAIVDDMKKDKELTAAIDILGTHQECYGSAFQIPPPGTMDLLKPLWSTELHIGEIGNYAGCDAATTGKYSIDLPAWDIRAGLHLARALNRGYLISNMTSTLIWTPVYSWYEYLLYGGKGLIVANTPWSGWYNIPDTVWMVAHTTQFVQPGWRFADSDGCKLMSDEAGSVVSYVSPSGKDLSIVIETAQSNATNTIKLQLSGTFASLKQLHMWKSERGSVFIEQAPLAVSGGAAAVTMPKGAVLTLTTTTGQKKGGADNTIPARANFTLPYEDDFDSVLEDYTPKYTSDMHGVFTAASEPSVGGKVLQQRTAIKPTSTAGGGNIYATIIGDGSWVDYEVSITARLPKTAKAELVAEAAEACTFNETVGRCGHLTQHPNASSFAECQAICCAQGTSCETAQWCPKTVSDCAKWAKSGRCWTGKSCRSSDKDGWKTAARGMVPAPPKPKPAKANPFLFLASHIGVYKDGSSCILSGKSLPEVCDEALTPGRAPPNATSESCCPIGKGGLGPSVIHSSGNPNPAGFVYRIDFDAAGGSNATWMLQTAKTCEASGRGCSTTNVAAGHLTWALGEWMTLKLSAKRQGNGKTELKWSAGSDGAAGDVHTATVDTLEEARAGVAFGNGEAMSPLSQWDNLSVTLVKSDDDSHDDKVPAWTAPPFDPNGTVNATVAYAMPVLQRTKAVKLYNATATSDGFLPNCRGADCRGVYSHAPMISYHYGTFIATWKNGVALEDTPGQRVLWSYATEDAPLSYSEPAELFGNVSSGAPCLNKHEPYLSTACAALFAEPTVEIQGRVYVAASLRQFCLWPLDHSNFAGGIYLLLRRVTLAPGKAPTLGKVFWAKNPGAAWTAINSRLGIQTLPQMDAETRSDIAALLRGERPCAANATKCEWCDGGCQPLHNLTKGEPSAVTDANRPAAMERAHYTTACKVADVGGPWIERTHYSASHRGTSTDYAMDVLLYRADGNDLCYSTRDNRSGHWTTPATSKLTDIHANFNAGSLPDGRVYLLHNPVIGPSERDPLVISLSSDGFSFDKAYVAISCRLPPASSSEQQNGCQRRNKGGGSKHGPQYSQGVVAGEFLFVIMSMNTEDVWVEQVPLSSLE